MPPLPEPWPRGPVPGVAAALQPAAHALLQVTEDLLPLLRTLTQAEVWTRPGGSAPIGFHVAHLAGSLDRLCTYARGKPLSEAQRMALSGERTISEDPPPPADLVDRLERALADALAQLRTVRPEDVFTTRAVGRAQLPSTVIGLLFHGAEHSARHAGQIATLAKVVRGQTA
jgi:hypothetical protein